MRFCIAVTFPKWAEFNRLNPADEINHWQPNRLGFKLEPYSPFLFKQKGAKKIIGYGFFQGHGTIPVSQMWNVFGTANGASSWFDFYESIKQASRGGVNHPESYAGYRLIAQPVFFSPENQFTIDWNATQSPYIYADTNREYGRKVYEQWQQAVFNEDISYPKHQQILEEIDIHDPQGVYRVINRNVPVRESSFRLTVTSNYQGRCLVSNDKTLPVLDAAHIMPYSEKQDNNLDNGILLRTDVHRLYDRDLLTITPDLEVKVSEQLKEMYHNGKIYYDMQRKLEIPKGAVPPKREYLEWRHQKFKNSTDLINIK